jgi:predicted RND superfamily exporter protein
MKNVLLGFNNYFSGVPGQLRSYRKTVLLLALVSTIFMAIGTSKFSFNFSIESWFEKGDSALEALDEFRQQFGSDDGLFIVYEAKDGDVFSYNSLSLIAEITDTLNNFDDISDDVWADKFGLKPEQYIELEHIKRVQSLTNIRVQQNNDDVLSSPLLVPKDIPRDTETLNKIKLLASSQTNLPLFMFSKDYRFGAISITTDFGTIPIISPIDSSEGLFSDDEWDSSFDNFESAVDDFATVTKVEFEEMDPNLYLKFMPAISAIYKQPHLLDNFDFYPIGGASMIELAWDTMIHAGFLLIGMVVVINVLLWTLFRSVSAVVLPQLAIGMSVVFVLGTLSWLGIESSSLITLTVMLIVAVGVADCVHVMSSYIFFRRDGEGHEQALSHAYRKTGVPILLTTITTMAGMASMSVTGMEQFVVFGISSAAGVGLAFIYTIYLLPVLLDYWHPMAEPTNQAGRFSKYKNLVVRYISVVFKPIKYISKLSGLTWLFSAAWLQPLLDKIPALVFQRRYSLVAIFVGVFGICLYGATQVKIDSNLVELFSEDVPIRAAYDIVDEHMMGTGGMIIMVDMGESDAIMDPEVLQAISKLQDKIKSSYDYIIRTNSLANLVKDTHQIMRGSEQYRSIPDSQIAVSQLLYLFNSANPEDRRALVSDDYSKTHISVTLKNAGSNEYKDFFEGIQKDIDNGFSALKARYPDMHIQITGTFALMMKLADDLSNNQFKSLAVAVLVISLLLVLTLGSVQAGLLSIIPNLIPATLAFGLMGLLSIPLDTDTLLIAPLIIGIAVDDTIHFITHYRMSLAVNNNMKLALINTIKEVGQAVTFTTLILGCGFYMLSFSDHLGLAKIGNFGSLAIFVALLCDLLFFPALIMIFKPKFGQQKIDDNLNFSEVN